MNGVILMAYKTQIFSDVERNGMGLELLSEGGDVLAEVFCSDDDHSVSVNTFDNDIPLAALAYLLNSAWQHLKIFEDGTAIDWAETL